MFLGYRYYVCVFGFVVPNLYLNGCVQSVVQLSRKLIKMWEKQRRKKATSLNSIKIAKSCSPVLR